MSKPIVIALGEILWDMLPTGKRAGGAPVNFAYHASQNGAESYAISAVGNDELGAELMQLTVPPGSRLHGVYLPELRLPEDAAVVLVVRDGKPFVPGPETRLMRGDQALLVSARGSRAEAERRLRAVSRAGRLATWRGEAGRPTEVD